MFEHGIVTSSKHLFSDSVDYIDCCIRYKKHLFMNRYCMYTLVLGLSKALLNIRSSIKTHFGLFECTLTEVTVQRSKGT